MDEDYDYNIDNDEYWDDSPNDSDDVMQMIRRFWV